MVFKLTCDEKAISCSSPSCVRRHLDLGWRLANPEQTADLLEALDGVEGAEPARAHFPTSLASGTGYPGRERS